MNIRLKLILFLLAGITALAFLAGTAKAGPFGAVVQNFDQPHRVENGAHYTTAIWTFKSGATIELYTQGKVTIGGKVTSPKAMTRPQILRFAKFFGFKHLNQSARFEKRRGLNRFNLTLVGGNELHFTTKEFRNLRNRFGL